MSGLPPYHSSPEARELWEITGALAEEERLRAIYEGRVLGCDFCINEFTKPENCPNDCPVLKNERDFEDYCVYMDCVDFMYLVDPEGYCPEVDVSIINQEARK